MEKNAYLALREQKIARNQARLIELGLIKKSVPVTTSTTTNVVDSISNSSSSSSSSSNRSEIIQQEQKSNRSSIKRKNAVTTAKSTTMTTAAFTKTISGATITSTPVRRSARLKSTSGINYNSNLKITSSENENRKRRKKQVNTTSPTTVAVLPVEMMTTPQVEQQSSSSIIKFHQLDLSSSKNKDHNIIINESSISNNNNSPPNSARLININVNKLLYDNGLLGQTMYKTGKAYVMEESARIACEEYIIMNNGSTTTTTISFNKYSGVQEWKNNVLYLWVNLHAPNNSNNVINEFIDHGKLITWFGGARMNDNTNVICKLKHIGLKAVVTVTESADQYYQGNDDDAIILWCRQYIHDKKTFTPYTCLGRLSLVSYDPTSRPLAFVWRLIDYEKLMNHPDKQIQETFKRIIQ